MVLEKRWTGTMSRGMIAVGTRCIRVEYYLEHLTEDGRNDYVGSVRIEAGDMSPQLDEHLQKTRSVLLMADDGATWKLLVNNLRPDGFTFDARSASL